MTTQPAPPPPPEGIVVDLVTPLLDNGDLDTQGLSRLVTLVAPEANGILAGSPEVGEALGLSFETRRRFLSHLLGVVAGQVPLFCTVTGHSLEETQELAEAVLKESRGQGYPGPLYLADLPLWYHSNRGLPQAYRRLLAEVPLPLVILNLPQVVSRRAPLFKHRHIRTQVFKKLTAIPDIVGLMYQGEMRRFLNYHYAAVRRPGFAFYEADESNFLTRPGAWGVVSASAQLLPAAWRQVSRACLHPEEVMDDQETRLRLWDLSQRLLEIARICRSHPAVELKAALAALKVLSSDATAADTQPAAASHRDELLALVLPLTGKP